MLCETTITPQTLALDVAGIDCDDCMDTDWMSMRLECLTKFHFKFLTKKSRFGLGSASIIQTLTLLSRATALRELTLEAAAAPLMIQHRREDSSFSFPQVRTLNLIDTMVTNGQALGLVLDTFPQLKTVQMLAVHLGKEPEVGLAWYNIFGMLRGKNITGRALKLRAEYFSRHNPPHPQGFLEACADHRSITHLSAYIGGQGEWTPLLDKEFKISKAKVVPSLYGL